jgi:hypothetical protein
MDISADLTELGRTPVAVVCAGVKSILDIPRTLEYLETQVQKGLGMDWVGRWGREGGRETEEGGEGGRERGVVGGACPIVIT